MKNLFIALAALVAVGCSDINDSGQEAIIVLVDSKMAYIPKVTSGKLILLAAINTKINGANEWTTLPVDFIEGFEFEQGYEYELSVIKTQFGHSGYDFGYKLKAIISKEMVPDFSGVYSVDNISVAPGEWNTAWGTNPDGTRYVDYVYADRHISEFTANVISNGAYMVYYKYYGPDDNGNNTVPVQQPLPSVIYGGGWEYTISFEPSENNLRLIVSASDGMPPPLETTMFFRLAIIR